MCFRIGPKGRLQHLMHLREIEVASQFQRPADNWLDPEDLSFEPDDKVAEIEALCHVAMMPPQHADRKFEGAITPSSGLAAM